MRRVGVGVCQTFQCTPDVEILASTCRMTDAHDSAGKVLTSPVGDVRPPCALDPAGMVPTSPVGDVRPPCALDPAGMVPTSPVGDGCPPCLLSALRFVRHEEKCHRPAM